MIEEQKPGFGPDMDAYQKWVESIDWEKLNQYGEVDWLKTKKMEDDTKNA